MYSVQSSGALARNLTARGIKGRVGGTVLLLGTCSLLTDISSEMVSAILPLYLVFTLGFSPLQYGVVDGIYQGAAALVRPRRGLSRRPLAPPQGRRRRSATGSPRSASSAWPRSAAPGPASAR